MEHHFSDQHTQEQVNVRTTMLSIEKTNATGTYLDHLNDDCLLEIFSKFSLTPMDLCSLAETCKLFKRIVQHLFPKKLAFNRNADVNDYMHLGEVSADDVDRIFKSFGTCLVAVSVGHRHPHSAMNWVVNNCVAGTLKELQIRNVEITDAVGVKLQPIVQQLQQLLSFSRVNIQCNASVFANSNSLTQLRIGPAVHNFNRILENNFPKLQRFSFWYNVQRNNFEFGFLLNFIQRNQTIKCMDLTFDESESLDDFVQKLGNICKELNELNLTEFDCNQNAKMDISNFQNLKRLGLCRCPLGDETCIVQLHNMKSLEALTIVGAFGNKELWDALPLLPNLRELDVKDCHSMPTNIYWTSLTKLTKLSLTDFDLVVNNVVDIIRRLTNLEELKIDAWNFILSEEAFIEIVAVVMGRPNVLTIKCRCRNFNKKIDFEKNLLIERL